MFFMLKRGSREKKCKLEVYKTLEGTVGLWLLEYMLSVKTSSSWKVRYMVM